MKLNGFVRIPRWSRLVAALMAFILLAGYGSNAAIAASEADQNLQNLGLDESMAQPIGEDEMGQMRGRFVAADRVLYFGMVLQSNLAGQNGNSLSAGLAFAVNFKSGTPQVVTDLTWATQNGTSATDVEGSGVLGRQTPLGGISGGIGQVIQVTGQGNQAFNQATLDLINSAPGSLFPNGIPNGMPCGSSCQSAIQNNALKVLVVMPGVGSAGQSIGPGIILQGIRLNGDLAQASNTMSMYLQLAQFTGLDTLGISTILQSVPLPPH